MQPLGQRLFELGRLAPLRRKLQVLAEPLEERGLDLVERRHAAESLAQRDHPAPRVVEVASSELVEWHFERLDHPRRIEVDQQRALEEKRPAVDQTAGAADLAPVHLDVVARAELGRHAQAPQPRRRSAADPRRDRREVRAEGPALQHQFPADLAFVQIQAAAAGDAAPDLDAAAAAVFETHLVAEDLVQANERRRAKAQETDRLRDAPGVARLDQRLVERDVFAAPADAGVDDPDGAGGIECRGNTAHG